MEWGWSQGWLQPDLYIVGTRHLLYFSLHVGVIFYCKRVLSVRPGAGKLVFAVTSLQTRNVREQTAIFPYDFSPEKIGQAWVMCQLVRPMTVAQKVKCYDQLLSCTIVRGIFHKEKYKHGFWGSHWGRHPNYKTLLKLPDGDLWISLG